MRSDLKPILIFNIAVLAIFGAFALMRDNFEFLLYLVVTILIGWAIIASLPYAKYPAWILWLLSVWNLAHMAGGLVQVGDGVLYSLMLIPIVGDPYLILKYDQVVHAYGFFTATLTIWYVLKPSLKTRGPIAVPVILFLAGMGLGAINELVEFTATVLIPNTNVGGYVNTGVDLVANGIGALAAALFAKQL